LESGHKESVRRAWDDNLTIALYEGEGLGIVPEWQTREAIQRGSQLWKSCQFFVVIIVVIVVVVIVIVIVAVAVIIFILSSNRGARS